MRDEVRAAVDRCRVSCRRCGGHGEVVTTITDHEGGLADIRYAVDCEPCAGSGFVLPADVAALAAEVERLEGEVERLRAEGVANGSH